MEGGFRRRFTVVHKDDKDNQQQIESPENSDESAASPMLYDSTKATSTSSSPAKSKRGTQKRVVHVPFKQVEGYSHNHNHNHHHRLKVEANNNNNNNGYNNNAPPASDSWAWRKYGQKPIKGSPYPRGYYRCSSSKGCPARKQVERSRTDPTMVMVTYSCDHNHPWPAASRNNHHQHHHHNPPTSPPPTSPDEQLEEEPPIDQTTQSSPPADQSHDQKFTSTLEVGPFTEQYGGWFLDLDSTSSTMLESPLMDIVEDSDMATIFSIREDEESFFADLGELPECTTVFRRRGVERVEEHRRNLAPWCGTTG